MWNFYTKKDTHFKPEKGTGAMPFLSLMYFLKFGDASFYAGIVQE